jgi:hypothetical protein
MLNSKGGEYDLISSPEISGKGVAIAMCTRLENEGHLSKSSIA